MTRLLRILILVETDIIAQFRFMWYASLSSAHGLVLPRQNSLDRNLLRHSSNRTADIARKRGKISAHPICLIFTALGISFLDRVKVRGRIKGRAAMGRLYLPIGGFRVSAKFLDHWVNSAPAIRCGSWWRLLAKCWVARKISVPLRWPSPQYKTVGTCLGPPYRCTGATTLFVLV
jgi:hypothetical protein